MNENEEQNSVANLDASHASRAGELDAKAATAQILSIDSAVRALTEQITVLKQKRAEVIVTQGVAVATLKLGDEVNVPYGYGRKKATRRYRITKIGGWFWSPRQVIKDAFDKTQDELSEGEFQAVYYGRQIKADGSLSDKEKRLYDHEVAPKE